MHIFTLVLDMPNTIV